MPELLTPGVIIQEVDFGPPPIEGVSTSTAGFVGEAERGPTEGSPILVTSFADFQRKFGGFVKDKHLAYAVRGFFDNGGRRAFIVRAKPAGASASFKQLDGSGHLVRLLGPSTASGGEMSLTLSSVVGLALGANQLTLINITTAAETQYNVLAVNGATGVVKIAAAGSLSVSPSTHYARITSAASTTSDVLTLEARDVGSFGKRISVLVEAHYVNSATVRAKIDATHYELSAVDFLKPESRIQLENVSSREVVTVTAIDAATRTITLSGPGPSTDYTGGKAFLIGWRVTVTFDGAVVETIEGLSSALSSGAAQDFKLELANRSGWVRATGSLKLDPQQGNLFPTFALAKPQLLTSGSDGAITDTEIIGSDVSPRTGLKAIEAQNEINLIAAPGFTSSSVIGELIGQAERRKDRFAVFESPKTKAATTEVLTERAQYNSRYAAMYHPWVKVLDPLSKTDIAVPPSGHVLGAYARTDNDRAVWKAPANVVLRSINGFEREVPDGEQDLLNPAGVNVLRRIEGLGNVIWGARTISSDGLWKYVPVRRLFIFIEQSIIKATRYAVFEPNDHRLWARLRDSLVNFLTSQWRAGALFGIKPEEAFFVKVDETTTTQDDRDNGRVNILVGIAPVKPAEFIVFQIGQAPQSVIVAEQS